MKSSCWRKVLPAVGGYLLVAQYWAFGQIPPATDHPASIQTFITDAFRAGQKRVTIPPGVYLILPPASGPHLLFRDLADFEIDAQGVELIFADRTRGGIEFQNCRKVVLSGVTVRFEVPPFTQGVIEDVSPIGDWYDVRIDRGYPADFDDPNFFPGAPFGFLFDSRTRNFRQGTFDLSEKSIERRGPDLFRLYRNRPSGPGVQTVAAGDLVAFRGSGQHNVSIVNSTGMRLDGVTVYNAAAFAVYEAGGEGSNHYRFTVKPGPRPPQAASDPLLSSGADAFHSVDVRRGPVLEGCHFEAMGDDGIAIHGTYSLVLEAERNRLVVSKSSFRPGDPLRLWDAQDRPSGTGVVRAVKRLEHFNDEVKSRRVTRTDNSTGPFWEITVSRPTGASRDYLASNPGALGSGYVLRNNTILNHRARGMVLKADSGVVEGNTIDGSTVGGIVLMPEFWWNEADYSRNVVIRNNTIRNVAGAQDSLGGMVVAALDKTPVPACGHRGIAIESNRFENINGVNLLITSACDVTVENNHFIGAQQKVPPEAGGAWWGEDPEAIIFITKSQRVRLKGNRASETGPFNRTFSLIVP